MWCFFFLQAEDCIRDLTVTGVQTCALPILAQVAALGREFLRRRIFEFRVLHTHLAQMMTRNKLGANRQLRRRRSEERRVGKSVELGGRRIMKKKSTQNSDISAFPYDGDLIE